MKSCKTANCSNNNKLEIPDRTVFLVSVWKIVRVSREFEISTAASLRWQGPTVLLQWTIWLAVLNVEFFSLGIPFKTLVGLMSS